MPFALRSELYKNLVANGITYQILFSFKQDSSKQIFKALRKDEPMGIQQEVLLKVFSEEKEFYREEFESLSQVLSPYCVRLLGFENFGNKKALVLEYIKGVSLSQLIETFSLSSREILYILTSIYKGLKALSKENLCHGDLSLDNVLIDEKAHVKLIDFGKANYEQGNQGTPPFIAPEIFQGTKANFLSDLYSLGIIEILLRASYPLSSLTNKEAKDFKSDSSLLSPDPKKRCFPYKTKGILFTRQNLKSLTYKVKDLLSSIESRRCKTLKNPCLKSPHFNIAKSFLMFTVLVLSGLAPFNQTLQPSQGFVKIYTNEWFIIRIGNFKSYAPVTIPLKTGWHSIQWKTKRAEGETRIFVSKGKSLFLNDKNLLTKESHD